MQKVDVFRVPTSSPDDIKGLQKLIDSGEINPNDIICVLGKTEGNGCVNDFTRGFATQSLSFYLAETLGLSVKEVQQKIAFIMSGGTEGIMSPHLTVFTKSEVDVVITGEKRLAAGIGFTRDFRPEEIGRMEQVLEVAETVKKAMADAKIESAEDVHFVQIKCPLLTAERIEEARSRGKDVSTNDTYKSMAYSRGASALGVALALGEVTEEQLSNEVICHDWDLYSGVASTSAGVELVKDEIIVIGNSTSSASELVIGHSVMKDAIDTEAVKEAMKGAGLEFQCCPSHAELEKIINVFAKAEAASYGTCRGRRNPMVDDSDINHTRSARAVVNAAIATLTKDPMVYVSGGAEHQGPDGGGPVAVIARA
ncbi:cyanuric acid amidohydrolase [Bacillus sp. FJAT-18017]|uniref:cyanuric acid amidohydrolase n=1 Tax=Bacillus sp. FJAT-18017 TaxID=1705566 RepID=UPI0006AFBEF2|nr:ring-opening amidohydrolase [Bacillus sp. FJAT-18017]ALC89226.1 cyanuric acid amidohydrolase [Bacillus sp. FJAT-18017]